MAKRHHLLKWQTWGDEYWELCVATNSYSAFLRYQPATRPAPRALRAVVVDDTPEILRTAVELLELDGQVEVVATAKDGLEAISAVRVYDPDLVLMDVNMPRMNGLLASIRIKESDVAPKVLIMSSNDDQDTRIAAMASGADAFLPKSDLMQHCRVQLRRLFPEHYPLLH